MNNNITEISGAQAEQLSPIDSRIVEADGRMIRVLTTQDSISSLHRIKSAILTPISLIRGREDQAKKARDKFLSGTKKRNYYVDVTKENTITKEALRHGLIPSMQHLNEQAIWANANYDDVSLQIRQFTKEGRLVNMIQSTQADIETQRDHFETKLQSDTLTQPSRETVLALAQKGTLQSVSQGIGGAYFLTDENNTKRFIIKPNDEDCCCLNNRKQSAALWKSDTLRVRDDIPTYESAQNEALTSDLAKICDLSQVVPETTMVILETDAFHLFTDTIEPKYRGELVAENGRKKLCSAQEFVPNVTPMCDIQATDVFHVDQDDFERTNLLIWITGDQDAHSGNLLLYDKQDSSGNACKGIKKID